MNWWRLNKRKNLDPFKIEWGDSGIVRIKLDCFTNWEYKKCEDAKFALSIAEGMIELEKAKETKKRDLIRKMRLKEFQQSYCGT